MMILEIKVPGISSTDYTNGGYYWRFVASSADRKKLKRFAEKLYLGTFYQGRREYRITKEKK